MSNFTSFPAPIGGLPLDGDFVPSIIIAFLFAVTVFAGFFQLVRKPSRSIAVISLLVFVIERWAYYSPGHL
jgi:hypothetical protein